MPYMMILNCDVSDIQLQE